MLDTEIKINLFMVGYCRMLLADLPGASNRPQAWLCRDTLGGVTHTFRPERGMVGGLVVPSSALRDNKVSAAKREDVTAFVESFGLPRDEAERVVSQVGVARPARRAPSKTA